MPEQNSFDIAAEAAAKKTDEELGSEEAKIGALRWDDIKGKLPSPLDQKNLDALIKIVNADTNENLKVAALTSNMKKLAGVIVKVLSNIR
jgi:hypothetical protein